VNGKPPVGTEYNNDEIGGNPEQPALTLHVPEKRGAVAKLNIPVGVISASVRPGSPEFTA